MADRNVKIADFDGDNMNVLEWIQSVRMCAGATDWDDGGICERAKLHLTGKARTWLQNRIMALTPGVDTWCNEPNAYYLSYVCKLHIVLTLYANVSVFLTFSLLP